VQDEPTRDEPPQDEPTLEDTLALMRDLRRRCEWDRAQTHESLRPYLIEEAYEVDEAIQQVTAGGDPGALRDELGDLLLQVLFHSVVAEERGAFGLHDVARALVAKMRARHPHLYPPDGAAPAARPDWERMKPRGGARSTRAPAGLPALHRAHRLQDRAAGVGFDWPTRGPGRQGGGGAGEVRAELAAPRAARDGPGAERSRPSWATGSSPRSTSAARRACTRRSPSTRRTRSSPGRSAPWSGWRRARARRARGRAGRAGRPVGRGEGAER
jgi:NTP pyrophosphatase (non-canonical NTP hydrolase)